MKKDLLFTACLSFLFSLTGFSQQNKPGQFTDSLSFIQKERRFYVNIHSGFSFALGSTFKFYPDDITSISVQVIENNPTKTNVSYKAPSKGLGDGFRFGAGFSYILNDFINVGLDVDYFNSTISKTKDSTYREVNAANNVNYTYNQRYTISYDASLLTITPSITFKAISKPRFFIYNKLGGIITIRPNSIQKEQQDVNVRSGDQGGTVDSTSVTKKRYDWGIKNPSYGFMGAIGMQVKLQERIRAFGEVQFSHVLFQVRSRSLTEFDVNGKNMVNTLPVAERITEFQRNLSTDDLNTNNNLPTKAIVQRFPVTYVGFQLGLAYRF